MTITQESLAILFNNNAPNARQRAILGIKLKHGWMDRLIGREVSDETFAQALACKGRRPPGVPPKAWRSPEVDCGSLKSGIVLTQPEIAHLLDLLDRSETGGEAVGCAEDYWSISASLTSKLLAAKTTN